MVPSAEAADIALRDIPEGLAEKLGFVEIDFLVDVSGPIEAGDAARLAALVEELDVGQFISGVDGLELVLRLDSPGGSFKEAIDLARIIDERQLMTFVESGAECLSACAVIFMAGTYLPGFRAQELRWRNVEWPARLGFHRPFLANLSVSIPPRVIEKLPPEEVGSMFQEQFLGAFDSANALIQEMLDVDPAAWSPALLVRMLTATSGAADGDFVYLETVDDALIWDIGIVNEQPPPDATLTERFVQHFWLCYNAGRAIPAYSGIWPAPDEAAENIDFDPESAFDIAGAFWDAQRMTRDGLTYRTRVRGWIFGCEISYESPGTQPIVTFVHDDARVTRTRLLDRHDPRRSLDEVAAIARSVTRVGVPETGRCVIFRRREKTDDEPCKHEPRHDPELGMVDDYIWPSGSRTVVHREAGQIMLNGDPVRSRDPAPFPDAEFCYFRQASGNTFCYIRR